MSWYDEIEFLKIKKRIYEQMKIEFEQKIDEIDKFIKEKQKMNGIDKINKFIKEKKKINEIDKFTKEKKEKVKYAQDRTKTAEYR